MQAGCVGQVEQAHVRFFRQSVAFAAVAGTAGGDAVHPAVSPASRAGDDVFAGQQVESKVAAAVGADLTVAGEELGVGQGRRHPPGSARDSAAHGDDGVHLDARRQPGSALDAAAQNLAGAAHGPGHTVASVKNRRLSRCNPRLRASGQIELQYVHGTKPPFGCLERTAYCVTNSPRARFVRSRSLAACSCCGTLWPALHVDFGFDSPGQVSPIVCDA